jgi:hypothetical protein
MGEAGSAQCLFCGPSLRLAAHATDCSTTAPRRYRLCKHRGGCTAVVVRSTSGRTGRPPRVSTAAQHRLRAIHVWHRSCCTEMMLWALGSQPRPVTPRVVRAPGCMSQQRCWGPSNQARPMIHHRLPCSLAPQRPSADTRRARSTPRAAFQPIPSISILPRGEHVMQPAHHASSYYPMHAWCVGRQRGAPTAQRRHHGEESSRYAHYCGRTRKERRGALCTSRCWISEPEKTPVRTSMSAR